MQGLVHSRAPKMLGVIVKMEIAAVVVVMMVMMVVVMMATRHRRSFRSRLQPRL